MGRNWQLVTKRKAIFHELCSEASSKLEEYGDVAQMVERSLSMREVRDRCPASPKQFWGFDNSDLYLLIMGRNWQLVTNGKLIFHELCSEASSKLEEYGDVAQIVERSLSMREVRGSMPRISKTILRIRQFWFVFADNGNKLTTRYKWKLIFHELCSEASSTLEEYGDVPQMVERSLSMREVRGSMPCISKTFFEDSITLICTCW